MKHKPSKNEIGELISMYYRIEQTIGNFSHVADCQSLINVEKIEAERKKLEKLFDQM